MTTSMTRCSCCGTTQGPFVRDRDLPGRPVCGLPRRAVGRHLLNVRIRDCLARRAVLDGALEKPHGRPAVPA